MVVIDARANTTKAMTPSARETFAFRISAAAASVSEYVSMNAPTRTPTSQFVRSRRSSHFGVSDVAAAASRRRRRARSETSTARHPTAISTAEAIRDGVLLCELKSAPWSTNTVTRPITTIARSQPATNAIARRRPAGIVSRTITVTTETGLQNATPRPSPITVRISVSTAAPLSHSVAGREAS